MRNFKKELLDDLEGRLTDSMRVESFEAFRPQLETLIERHVTDAARRIEDDLQRFKHRMVALDMLTAIVIALPVALAAELLVKHWPEIQLTFQGFSGH